MRLPLLQLADTLMHPTSGTVTILDEQLGRTDVFELRPRIGFASSAMARRVPPEETVLDVVLTAAFAVVGRWNEEYENVDERQNDEKLMNSRTITPCRPARSRRPTRTRRARNP
jgi:ABC-type molybdenum transport system ATPase subunit/photorepair protein PhrA